MNVKNRKALQSEGTRDRLVAVARGLFATQGYAATSTEQIVQEGGVTRGALYHQFRDKQDLFRAVYEAVERDWTRGIADRLGRRNPSAENAWEELRAGAQSFLDVSLSPEVQRIALLEAPAVLGANVRGEIAPFGLKLIRRVLERAIEQGVIEPQPLDPLAHLLRALITEGAMLIARADDPKAARAEVGAALDRLIRGVNAPAAPAIVEARDATAFAGGRALFQEYAAALGVDLCFQNFTEELAALETLYAPPAGCLLLARDAAGWAGCVAVRRHAEGECEMKRLYVRPAYRQTGLGRRLAEAALRRAREFGYRRMVLDTLEGMSEARALYRSLGFRETQPYYPNPLPGVRYLTLDIA